MNESKSGSRTARLVKMAGAGVAAKTNKTTTAHLSSASVDTEAACHAALGVVGIHHLLEEIGIWCTINVDNQNRQSRSPTMKEVLQMQVVM
jgi:hypothetical protein